MKLSIVLPVYNEAESLPHLFDELKTVLDKLPHEYEIIAINDGSQDDSWRALNKYAKKDKRVKLINFLINGGQTSAIRAGIDHASGDVIVPMDSDLENDPADIPRLLEELEKGYDVVSGWRRDRWNGSYLKRKLPSDTANWLISFLTKTKLRDHGCTLKAYRSEAIKGTQLYGEMHRFISAYAALRGGKVGELVINHRPRRYGKSNYGITRTFRVLLDLLLIRFLHKYMNRPIHFFGMAGFYSFGLAGLSGLGALYLRFFVGISLIQTPLPVLTALLIIVGVQLIGMGILAEMVMRVYYEAQNKAPYVVREKVNLEE
jgi:glycosyltransferase involved in cell wall biosynthesis